MVSFYLFSLICCRKTLQNCFDCTRICWNSCKIFSVINVIIMTITFHWGSTETQYAFIALLPFQASSLWTQVTNSGDCFHDVDLPKGQVSYLKHSNSCLDCTSWILCNIASGKQIFMLVNTIKVLMLYRYSHYLTAKYKKDNFKLNGRKCVVFAY